MGFIAGKLAWIVAQPSNLLAILLGLGLVFRLFGRRHTAHALMGTALAAFLACVALPLGAWLLAPLENRFPVPRLPERVDGIVVLGGAIQSALSAERKTLVLNGNVERLIGFAELARRYPDAKLVFTGGSGDPLRPEAREGDWVGAFLDAVGVPRGRVTIERASRTTEENARLGKAAAKPRPGETWVLITSARHMPRAVGVFRKQGWAVLPYPVDYLTAPAASAGFRFDVAGALGVVDAAAYEWFGLVYYRLRGEIDGWFPGPQAQSP